MILEICCSGLNACMEAVKNGANRIELCGSMSSGGLTPSFGLFQLVKKHCHIPVAVMIRSRGTGFCYQEHDFITMEADARIFLEHGADGIVFGFLTPDKQIDQKHVKQFCELAHAYGKEAVFHKAIDETSNLIKEIEVLCELGVDRVLTSGGQGMAEDNIEVLQEIIKKFKNRIQVLIGGGVRSHNVLSLLQKTNATQVHSACRVMLQDPSIDQSDLLTYENAYDSVSGEEVYRMACEIKKLL